MGFQFQIIFQLILAVLLGGIVGLERELKRKEAGLQTYSLVALGACLLTILAFGSFNLPLGGTGVSFDPSRVIQAIAIGIGFVAAGVVFKGKTFIEGLTTAAGLWVAAAIGIAVGTEFYFLAVFATFLTLGILAGLGLVERKVFHQQE